MLVTLDTSHLEISPLNLSAPGRGLQPPSANNGPDEPRLVTAEMSQDPIGPCGPLEQSKSERFRHSLMAAVSSAFDFGVALVGIHNFPGEPASMLELLALDFCHAPQSVLEKDFAP